MLTELTELGFKEYPVQTFHNFDSHFYKTIYKKKDDNDKNDSLLLEVKFWRFSKYSTVNNAVDDCWSCEGHFEISGKCFRVDCSIQEDELSSVVEWFKSIFVKLGGGCK